MSPEEIELAEKGIGAVLMIGFFVFLWLMSRN